MCIKKCIALRCINNRFRIESLTSESESNLIVRCQEIPTPIINSRFARLSQRAYQRKTRSSSIFGTEKTVGDRFTKV
jgi:hypothetical protein